MAFVGARKALSAAALCALCAHPAAGQEAHPRAWGCSELFRRMASLYGEELALGSSADREVAARRFVRFSAWARAAGLDPMAPTRLESAMGSMAERSGAGLEGMPAGEAACEAAAQRMQAGEWGAAATSEAWQRAVQDLSEIDYPLAVAEARRIAAWGGRGR